MTLMMLATVSTQAGNGIYKQKVKDDSGKTVKLKQYKGKVLLIVNTATKCGFTPQYKELQALYTRYAAEGLEILDFPCNQFGQQAPGTIAEIHQFCTANFAITFPQFDKVDVNGPEASPLFTLLKSATPFRGFDKNDQRGLMMHKMMQKRDPNYEQSTDIKWNFTKFLVNRKGRVIRRFEPTESIGEVEAVIKQLLR